MLAFYGPFLVHRAPRPTFKVVGTETEMRAPETYGLRPTRKNRQIYHRILSALHRDIFVVWG